MTAPSSPPPTGPTRPLTPARAGRHPVVRSLALGLGGILTVIVIGLAAVSGASVLVRSTEDATRTLEGRVERVVVRVDGSATVEGGGPTDRAEVVRRSSFGFARPEVTQTLVDGLLTVRVRCDGWSVICHSRVTVTVPSSAAVDVGAGRILVSDVEGRVDAASDGGSVELVHLDGPIDARVGGGSIIAERLGSDDVRTTAGTGAIELSFREPPEVVEADAGAGHVEVVVPTGSGAYLVDARSGLGGTDVAVATDPTSPRRIRAHAGAGGVEIRYGPA